MVFEFHLGVKRKIIWFRMTLIQMKGDAFLDIWKNTQFIVLARIESVDQKNPEPFKKLSESKK